MHGEVEGKKRWAKYIKTQAYVGTSKQYFIDKYGYTAGILIYLEVNDKKRLNLKTFIRKYGKNGHSKYQEYINKKHVKYSNISQKLFNTLDKAYPDLHKYYATKNTEFGKQFSNGIYVKLDFYIPEILLCVEFNGDIFHANPDIFNPEDHPNVYNKKLSSVDIWEKDRKRYETLYTEYGIKTIVVWEKDYRDNPIKEVNRINKKICDHINLKK